MCENFHLRFCVVSPKILQPAPETIALAARHLAAGGLVAIPTETVYGLAANAANRAAVTKMYQAKGRPADHPVIVHIGSIAALDHWAKNIPGYALTLITDYWPGPMTLVLQRTEQAGDHITGSQDSVAVRMPNHPVALELLKKFEQLGGFGLVAPSANRFGSVSPTSAAAVAAELGEHLAQSDIVLDGGQSEVGLESTIIDCRGFAPMILRPGAISAEMIERSCDLRPISPAKPDVRVSGSLKQHYSPSAKVQINQDPTPGAGLIALDQIPTPQGVTRLASPTNTEEFAHELYAALRRADELGLNEVFIFLPPGDGLALAIADRVTRAAAK